ncbi:MAG: hypothetical protein J6Y62_05030 [Clostridia bacterium]|nr:hypothetical protein [Clostridia bacterium]
MKDIKEKLRRFHEEMRKGDRKVTPKMLRTLMDNIDFESVMARLGIEVRSCGKDEYVGYCPNHLQHSSQPPSDPKWYINSRTGLTYCMTKSVGSNLIEIAKYVLGLDTNRQAYEALLSGRPVEVKIHVEKREEPEPEKDNADRLAESISSVMPFFMNPVMTDGCLEYFAKDGISKDTLEEYGVVACEYGKYRDRALIPFLKENDEICGYIAVDTLGKEVWAESNARRLCTVDSSLDFEACKEELAKKYRKTLYAPGFESRHHLYGLYEKPDFMEDTSEVLLVEGERDALKMLQEGIRCLGCHGTSIKEEQKIMLN